MTGNSVIRRAMRLCSAIAAGETPTASETADCLEALNAMLSTRGSRRLFVYFTTWESFNLVAGTALYTIGTGGSGLVTARPKMIQGAFVRDANGTDHHVDIIGADHYRRLGLKSNSARPDKLWYNPTYPAGSAYVYPTPAAVEALHVWSLKPLTAITDPTATISMPGEYEEAIVYNLCVRIAPEFGRPIPVEVAAIATAAMETLMALNAANQMEEIFAEPAVARGGGRYDINAG